jgi:hypothetical protein
MHVSLTYGRYQIGSEEHIDGLSEGFRHQRIYLKVCARGRGMLQWVSLAPASGQRTAKNRECSHSAHFCY